MHNFRSILGRCALALAACLSYMGFAYAAESHQVVNAVRYAIAEVGGYGAEAAKLKAELSYMASKDESRTTSYGSLTRQSNGFVQTVLVTESGSDSRTGIGAGLTSS